MLWWGGEKPELQQCGLSYLKSWQRGCAILGFILWVTWKQVLRLGKMPPVSPRGMERMATHHAAGSHLAESSAPPWEAGPPTQAVTIGLASVLLGLALCRLGGSITGVVPALCRTLYCGDRRRSGLQRGWVLVMLGFPCLHCA